MNLLRRMENAGHIRSSTAEWHRKDESRVERAAAQINDLKREMKADQEKRQTHSRGSRTEKENQGPAAEEEELLRAAIEASCTMAQEQEQRDARHTAQLNQLNQNREMIDRLLEAGFAREVCELALVHTGAKGVPEAMEWILENEEVVTAMTPPDAPLELEPRCANTTPAANTPAAANQLDFAFGICDSTTRLENGESLLFVASQGNSMMHSTTDRVRQILLARNVQHEEIDLCDAESGQGIRAHRQRMEQLSGGIEETPQLYINGRFIGAGRAALEELMFLIDSGQDLQDL